MPAATSHKHAIPTNGRTMDIAVVPVKKSIKKKGSTIPTGRATNKQPKLANSLKTSSFLAQTKQSEPQYTAERVGTSMR